MTKFQKFQRISSIIPFYSSFFVFTVTMIELKKQKASTKLWLYFTLVFGGAVVFTYLLNQYVMTGQHLLLNYIATGLLLAAANILCVDIQVMCHREITPAKSAHCSVRWIVYASLILIVIAVICLIGMYLFPSVEIEDMNGPNRSNVVTITKDRIISTDNNYSALGAIFTSSGSATSVTGELEKYDYDVCYYSYKNISGIKTLHATKSAQNNLTLAISSTLESGNMELFLIIDGQYYDSIQANESKTVILNNISCKTVVIKMAAESARVKVSISRKIE